MANKTSINIHLIVFIIILFISLGMAIYYKNSSTTTTEVSMLGGENEESLPLAEEIEGRIVSINTNAKSLTFIKVKNSTDKMDYTLSTYLDISKLQLNIGDVIRFSRKLEKSQNDAYYIIRATHDFDIVKKNEANIKENDEIIALSSINSDMQGHQVTTFGSVSNLYTSSKGHTFFTITNQKYKIKGVLFSAENSEMIERLELLKKYNDTNENIYFKGKVDIYKNELEIIVSKVFK